MLLGYTINGAIQMRIEDRKGSIETGKDADFLVFEENMLTAEPYHIHEMQPQEVYFSGERM